jgi:hypothetical protein
MIVNLLLTNITNINKETIIMKTILNQDEKLINIINENLSNTEENKVSEKYILNNIEIYVSEKQLKILNKL